MLRIERSRDEQVPDRPVHFDDGTQPKLDNVNRVTGARTPLAIFATSDELKVATVRQSSCQGGFTAGTIFTGNGNPGEIAKIEPQPNGTYTVTSPWVVLPGEGSQLRGGFFQDRWCVAGGDRNGCFCRLNTVSVITGFAD